MIFAAVQKHIAVLERAGLVTKRRIGRRKVVRTDVEGLRAARRLLDPRLDALSLQQYQRLVENQLARALVAGEFRPGDRVTADADLTSGTLVFSSEGATVVGEAGRRDARRREDDEPVAAGRRGRGRSSASPLDLPPTRPKRDDGELVN